MLLINCHQFRDTHSQKRIFRSILSAKEIFLSTTLRYMIDCDSDDNDSYDKVDYNDCFANRAIAHQLVLYTPWSVIGAVE